jgi:hypothetical protein
MQRYMSELAFDIVVPGPCAEGQESDFGLCVRLELGTGTRS